MPTRATILAALRTPIPVSSVRVVPDASTAAAMSPAALAEVVPGLVELEVAVPPLETCLW